MGKFYCRISRQCWVAQLSSPFRRMCYPEVIRLTFVNYESFSGNILADEDEIDGDWNRWAHRSRQNRAREGADWDRRGSLERGEASQHHDRHRFCKYGPAYA